MLARDVVFEGWTAADWARLLSLFKPAHPMPEDPARPRGGVLVIHDGSRIRKLLHTRVGRLDPTSEAWPASLADLAERHRASWVVAARFGALDEVMERFGVRARRGDDISAQALTLLGIARELEAEGLVQLWPRGLQAIRVPAPGLVHRTMDAVCGAGRAAVVGIFDRGELWTCIAMLRGPQGFERIVGPDELRRQMGPLAGDWRRDYRHLARAVELTMGELSLGCFAEVETLRALEVEPAAGAWARAVAVRDVVLSPLPGALAIPLAIDAARAMLITVQDLAQRFDPIGVVHPLVSDVVSPALERLLPPTLRDRLRGG
jgi:hypothetical protein